MPEKVPILIMIQGQEPGARWRLEQTRVTTLGRSKRNQIKLSNPSVSRFHCEISYINGLWYVADLNSKKGTYLNGREVTEREVIKPGDVIRLNKNVFKFDMVAQEDDEDMQGIRQAAGPKESRYAQMQQSAASSDGQKKAEKREETRQGARWANFGDVVFLTVVALVLAGLGYGSLAYAGRRASKIREQFEKRQEKRRRKLNQTLADVRGMMDQESPPFEEGYSQLQKLIDEYPGAPQAREAVRLKKRLEMVQFQKGMEQVQNHVGQENYRAAFQKATRLTQQLSSSRLVDIVREQRSYIYRIARVSLKRLLNKVRMMIRDGGVSQALNHFAPRYKRLAVTEKLMERSRQMLEKLKKLDQQRKEWEKNEEEGSGPVTDEEIRRRFKPPEEVNW